MGFKAKAKNFGFKAKAEGLTSVTRTVICNCLLVTVYWHTNHYKLVVYVVF